MRTLAIATALALAVSASALVAAEATPPDFNSADAVMDSISEMEKELAALSKNADHPYVASRAMRAKGACHVAWREVQFLVTAANYSAKAGERRWRECAHAYETAHREF